MPLVYHWHDEQKTIMYYKITPPFDWDEFFAFSKEANDNLILALPHDLPIQAIADFSELTSLPPQILQRSDEIKSYHNPRLDQIVVIHKNMIFRMVINIIRRTGHPLGRQLKSVSSIEEAELFLAQWQSQAIQR